MAEKLRDYAEHRLDASRTLVEGLRARNPEQIREALEMAREAPRSNPADTNENNGRNVDEQGKGKR
jgi:rhomboid protease GluP